MESETHPPEWLKPGRLLLYLFLVCCGIAVAAFALRPRATPLPPILILPPSYAAPPQRMPLFTRLVPPTKTWAWLWRLREAVLGKTPGVQIDAKIFAIPEVQLPALSTLALPPATSPDWPGLKVWLLEQGQLASLQQGLKTTPGAQLLNSPRMITGDGIDASLFVGSTLVLNGATNEVGLSLTCLTRTHQDVTDLTAFATYLTTLTNHPPSLATNGLTEWISIRTNLNLKARFQIPKGKGVFLLQSPTEPTSTEGVALILSTKR